MPKVCKGFIRQLPKRFEPFENCFIVGQYHKAISQWIDLGSDSLHQQLDIEIRDVAEENRLLYAPQTCFFAEFGYAIARGIL